jgi:hypothetical protein
MSDHVLIYCATPPTDALNTLGLLQSSFHAVWYPPDARRVRPAAGDRLWVLWRRTPADPATLLGTGRLRPTPTGEILWTNRAAPGLGNLARQFGYRGPSNMAFLRVDETRIAPANIGLPGLGPVPTGVSEASEAQRDLLEAAFRLNDRRANPLQSR